MNGDLLNGEGVERPGPGAAPTAFRIWRAGTNPTDIGPCNLTPAALARLLAAQEQRGNRYSFDLAHGTLDPQAPRDRQVAYGDHRIEGRDGELWAVDCQWSEWARAQIEQKPVPGLRYYSPAYDVDKETREPVRYVNCALTPNPATWNATALAAAKGTTMDPEKDKPPGDGAEGGSGPSVDVSTVVAGLHKLMVEAKDDGEREMYRKALAALMAPKDAAEGAQAAEGEGGDDKGPPSSKDGGALAKASKKAAAPAPGQAASTDVPPAVLQLLEGIGGKVAELAGKFETREKAEAAQRATAEATERASLAGRKGLSPEVVAAIKDKGTSLQVARMLASTVKLDQDPRALAGLAGGTRGNPETAIAQLPAEQTAVMHAQMGITPTHAPAARVDELGQFHRPTETPRQARERLAAAEKGAAR